MMNTLLAIDQFFPLGETKNRFLIAAIWVALAVGCGALAWIAIRSLKYRTDRRAEIKAFAGIMLGITIISIDAARFRIEPGLLTHWLPVDVNSTLVLCVQLIAVSTVWVAIILWLRGRLDDHSGGEHDGDV